MVDRKESEMNKKLKKNMEAHGRVESHPRALIGSFLLVTSSTANEQLPSST